MNNVLLNELEVGNWKMSKHFLTIHHRKLNEDDF